MNISVLPKPLDQSSYLSFSAKTGQGLFELLELIEQELPEKKIMVSVLIPFSEGRITSDIHKNCKIFEMKYTTNGTYFNIEVPAYLFPILEKFMVENNQ